MASEDVIPQDIPFLKKDIALAFQKRRHFAPSDKTLMLHVILY